MGIAVVATLAAVVAPGGMFSVVYAHSSLAFPALPALATLRAWRKLRRSDDGRAWRWVLAGVAGFFLYEVLWYSEWLTGHEPSTALAETANALFPALLLVGLIRGSAASVPPRSLQRNYLDAVVLALAAGTLLHAAVSLLGGGLRPIHSLRDLLLLVSPLVNLATLSGLALIWVRQDGDALPRWIKFLGASLLISLIGDVWYAVPASVETDRSPWFVVGAWYGSWAAIGLGAVEAGRPAPRATPSLRVSRLPYLLALGCYCALAIAVALDHRPTIVTTTIAVGVLTVLVLIRQLLALSDVASMQRLQAQAAADKRLAALVMHGNDMLAIIDPDMVVKYASPSTRVVLGVPPEQVIGRNIRHEIHRDDLSVAETVLSDLVNGRLARDSFVVRLRDVSGRWLWIEAVGSSLLHEPDIAGIVLNARDISDRKELEVQLLEQALRDPLTGLANRRLFGDRVSHALSRRHRRPDSVAVLILDLDHFKIVNDSLGHAKGDALLMAVAGRLRGVLREADTVARLGGDEFAVLLEDLEAAEEADATAQRILEVLDAPFSLGEREVVVRASIGIAWASEGQSVDDLLTEADVAMYGAKSSGRGRIERFSTAMRAHVAERHDVEADLRRALDRGEFEVYYQPVVDLVNGRVSGAEALVRWAHPNKGLILPARFISVAEESDLILAIGRLVLQRAMQDVSMFRAIGDKTARLRIGVNLSARQLLSPELVPDVHAALAEARVAGNALAFELTESVLASSESVVTQRLQALRDLGVRIALDDFGTGYSALAYLRRYPIDLLKIDKSFVSWVRDDVAHGGVTKAIIAMGQSLSMRTIAEGIETREQLEWLQSLGCSLGQGYLFSVPLPRDGLIDFLREWDPTQFQTVPRARVSGLRLER